MPVEIDGKQIHRWAEVTSDEGTLRRLIARLLWASATMRQLRMGPGSARYLAGWDGLVECVEGSAYCPIGLSGWELSTRGDIKRKLDEDYQTRKGTLASSATYVAVTARRYTKKEEWAEAKRTQGDWANVQVLDADDLAGWLGECPSVAAWFASEHLLDRRPAADLTAIDDFLARWSRATKPALPGSVLLVGREEHRAELLRWLAQGELDAMVDRPPVAPLVVQAATKLEARAFVAAALDGLDELAREQWAARTLIIESREAWRWATAQRVAKPLVLIPNFDEFELGMAPEAHLVVVPQDREARIDRGVSVLALDEPLPWRLVADALQQLGLPEATATRIAEQSRGQIHALRRLLGEITPPRWAAREEHAELVAMLLVGAWQPTSEVDRQVVDQLGVDPDALDRMCMRLMSVEGAPIESRTGVYRWASFAAAWRDLAPLLSERTLEGFVKVAVEVLGEDDPRYDRPPNERFFPATLETSPRCSGALRRGLAESLLYLSRADDALRQRLGQSLGSRAAERVVHSVLKPHWKRWASLEHSLTLMAEAAPQRFLACLRASLADPEGVGALFEQEGDPILSGSTPHVGLIRALELLAWDPRTMSAAVDALASLAEIDGPFRLGRIGNRPLPTLEAIFHTFTPQTLVEEKERFEVLDTLLEKRPALGFELLSRLMRTLHGSTILPQSQQPLLGELKLPANSDMPTVATVNARGLKIFERLLDAADQDPDRWARLVNENVDATVDEPLADQMLERLMGMREVFNDEAAAKISAEARDRLHLLYFTSSADEDPSRRDRLRRILDVFVPHSVVWRVAWLFEQADVLPEPHPSTQEEIVERLDELRASALEELRAVDGEDHDLLAALVDVLGEDLSMLGRALARAPERDEFETLILRGEAREPLQRLAPFLAAHWFWREDRDHEWLCSLISKWLERGRGQDALDTLLKIWSEPPIWDLLDEVGDPLRARYWALVPRVFGDDGETRARAITNLCEAGNIAIAFETAWHKPKVLRTKTLFEVLERLHDVAVRNSAPRNPSFGIQRIFQELDRRHAEHPFEGEELGQAVGLEIRYIEYFSDRDERQAHFISTQLEQSPQLFVQLLELQFRADDESIDEEPSPERVRAASNAGRILRAWNAFPGRSTADPDERDDQLFQWAQKALELSAERRRTMIGQQQVGEVLARPRAAADGYWPCVAARQLLEDGSYPELRTGLYIGKRNQRGVWTRGLYEGGVQEQALAEQFQGSARALRARWPATAQLLDELAESYGQDAEKEDNWAQARRHRYGEHPEVKPPKVARPTSVASSPAPTEHPSADLERMLPISRLGKFELQDVGPAKTFALELGQRLTMLTGDNSLGKTFLLDVAWWALTGTWPEADVDPALRHSERMARPTAEQLEGGPQIRMRDEHGQVASSGFDRVNERWPRRLGWPAAICPVIYARLDDGFSIWDPLRNGLSGTGGTEPEFPAYHFTEQQVWRGLFTEDDVPLCSGLITDWRDWSQGDERTAFDAMMAVLDKLSEPGMKLEPGRTTVKLSKHDDRRIPTLRFPYGDVPLVHLSAGWKRIIGLAYLLVWTWSEHLAEAERQGVAPSPSIVLLIDEAEAHLHPRWQRVILPAVIAAGETIGDALSVQVVVTTHSPMVTASLESVFDGDCDRVYLLEMVDRQVELREFPWAKFGDASSWLESPLFGLDIAMTPEAEAALNAAYEEDEG